MKTKAQKTYHHGNLRSDLLDLAYSEVAAVGPEALSARAVAKSIGVSSAAVYRHFPDKRAFLTAIATLGFKNLGERISRSHQALERKDSDDHHRGDSDVAKARATGEEYLEFALSEPNIFRLMFRSDIIDAQDSKLLEASESLPMVTPEHRFDATRRQAASNILAWAVVHGLATLSIDRQLDRDLPTEPEARLEALKSIIRYMGPTLVSLQAEAGD